MTQEQADELSRVAREFRRLREIEGQLRSAQKELLALPVYVEETAEIHLTICHGKTAFVQGLNAGEIVGALLPLIQPRLLAVREKMDALELPTFSTLAIEEEVPPCFSGGPVS